MNKADNPFEAALEGYKRAVFGKDLNAFVALYHESVCVFDMWGTWSVAGIEAWRDMAAQWFSSLGDERVIVQVAEPHSMLVDGCCFGHAILTYTAISSEGEELRSLSNRITLVMRRAGERWQILHEHTSSPVDHGSLRAMLQYPVGSVSRPG